MSTAVIIPAKNEAENISIVLKNTSLLEPDIIVVVVNGSTDHTLEKTFYHDNAGIHIIEFKEPLGVDVPRALGAKYAYLWGAEIVIFIDGDMVGNIGPAVQGLISGVRKGTDLALVNCYPYITHRVEIVEKMLDFRRLLNQELGLFRTLGVASPSQGPHAVSRRLLEKIGFKPLAVPPMELALAKIANMEIQVHAALPSIFLEAGVKSQGHIKAITETIIGDCVEAINHLRGSTRKRSWEETIYTGYNKERRFDLLEDSLKLLENLSLWQ